jgi:amino acid adenylation domain-containing protein
VYLQRILDHLDQSSADIAFNILEKDYSYAELKERISAIYAHCIQSDEQIIGISTDDHLDTYAAIIAVWCSGKTMVPLNLSLPVSRVQAILDQTEIKTIFVALEKSIPAELTEPNFVLSSTLNAEVKLENKSKNSENAYILFTSGSTGAPKGVPITHHALNAFTEAFFALPLDVKKEDRFLQMFELTFDLSLMSYVIPLTIGASVHTVGDEGMKYMQIFRILEDHDISVALMVPSVLAHLRPYFDEIDLPAMRHNLFCGEALPQSITAEWKKSVPNAQLFNVYGPTEATIFCMSHLYSEQSKATNGILSIGKAMHEMKMAIVDESSIKVGAGEKGELCLAGPQLTAGYWKNPEKSAEVFLELDGTRFYRSGDIALKDEDGEFHYLGRVDQQVKIEGFRVELSEVEHWLRKVSGIAQVAAVVQANEMGAHQIYSFLESEQVIDENELKEKLKSHLPSYMIPKKMISLDTFPLNVNGKIDRKALKASLS